MKRRRYETPVAFKAALEERLRRHGIGELTHHRQLVIFERFLARIAEVLGDTVTLKGGLVIELRLERARTTKDVDLRVIGSSDNLLPRLQAIGKRDLGDFMAFEIAPHADHPIIDSDGLRYDGLRFRAECQLAGKIYGDPFGVDIVFGEPMFGEPDVIVADDTLGFAGITPPTLRVYPVETHLAEKLHAYTLPRVRPNSRVKDLPDLALLATTGPLDATHLRAALEQTFGFRQTHELPVRLPAPPLAWLTRYADLAREDDLPWATLDDVTRAASEFLDPILAGVTRATWSPDAWVWRG